MPMVEGEYEMIGMDDSKENLHLVELIKKVALAIQSKKVKDLQEMVMELENWNPEDVSLDIKTKIFVEHILLAFSRIELGLDVLDKAANELEIVKSKMTKKNIKKATEKILDKNDESKYAGDSYNQEENEESIRKALSAYFDKPKSKCGKCGRVVEFPKALIFADYGICLTCYLEEPNIDEIYNDESIQPKISWARLNDREEDCRRCGETKKWKNMKILGGKYVCGECYTSCTAWLKKDRTTKDKEIKNKKTSEEDCRRCGETKKLKNMKVLGRKYVCGECYTSCTAWLKKDRTTKDKEIKNKKTLEENRWKNTIFERKDGESWDEHEKRLGDISKKLDEMERNRGRKYVDEAEWWLDKRYGTDKQHCDKKDFSDDEKEDLK